MAKQNERSGESVPVIPPWELSKQKTRTEDNLPQVPETAAQVPDTVTQTGDTGTEVPIGDKRSPTSQPPSISTGRGRTKQITTRQRFRRSGTDAKRSEPPRISEEPEPEQPETKEPEQSKQSKASKNRRNRASKRQTTRASSRSGVSRFKYSFGVLKDVLTGKLLTSTSLVVDGTKVFEVKFKSGQVVSVLESDHNSSSEALEAATSKRSLGSTVVVWCGPVTARVARPVEAGEHPKAVPLADARYLMKVFGEDRLVAMSGTVALSPAPNAETELETAKHFASMKMPLTLAGMCVGLDQDGIWLRVGRSSVEATLVHNGQINGWTVLCDGVDSVAEKIRRGQPSEIARNELAERVASETRRRIMQWQRTRSVPAQIWLHGPGGDPSGEVHNALLHHSGCRVTPPAIDMKASLEAVRYLPLLPTAVQSLVAPRTQRPKVVLQEVGKTRKRLVAKIAVSVVAVLAAIAAYAAYSGQNIDSEIATLKTTLADLQSEIDNMAPSNKAEALVPVVDLLYGEESPDWEMMFRINERFQDSGGDTTVASNGESLSVSVKVCCGGTDDHVAILEELDHWAEVIFGAGAQAFSESSIEEPASGVVDVTADLRIEQ